MFFLRRIVRSFRTEEEQEELTGEAFFKLCIFAALVAVIAQWPLKRDLGHA